MKISQVRFEKSATAPDHYPTAGYPEVAFVGRSNVGKSSVINTLIERKRLARTSTTPGRTQQINFYTVNEHLYFVDLPGYGYARVPRSVKKEWGPMIERYFGSSRSLCLVVFILDIRRDPSDDDIAVIDWLHEMTVPWCFIVTKSDKFSRGKARERRRSIARSLNVEETDMIIFSAKTKEGRDQLCTVIDGAVGPEEGE